MNILHVITSMGFNWGGPALTTLLTVRGLREMGLNAYILTNGIQADDKPISEETFITYLSVLQGWQMKAAYSGVMKKAIRRTDAALYHIQGLWQYPGYVAAAEARKRKVPYIITLHGQLYPQALALSSARKKIALSLFQRRMLQEASCVQATCMDEYKHYRALGFTNPVAVVPNPIVCEGHEACTGTDDVKRIGYLGRIHPRKNIHNLIEVWARLQVKDGELLIMGDGDKTYMKQLKDKVESLNLTNVVFTGFVTGEKKKELLASLLCLVVPSDFENFGMIIPEALLQNVPVIASKGTPWSDLNTYGCGWWVDNDIDTLTEAVRDALAFDNCNRREMGRRGRELILQKYSLETVSVQMKQVYEWVNGEATKPDFVYTD